MSDDLHVTKLDADFINVVAEAERRGWLTVSSDGMVVELTEEGREMLRPRIDNVDEAGPIKAADFLDRFTERYADDA